MEMNNLFWYCCSAIASNQANKPSEMRHRFVQKWIKIMMNYEAATMFAVSFDIYLFWCLCSAIASTTANESRERIWRKHHLVSRIKMKEWRVGRIMCLSCGRCLIGHFISVRSRAFTKLTGCVIFEVFNHLTPMNVFNEYTTRMLNMLNTMVSRCSMYSKALELEQ